MDSKEVVTALLTLGVEGPAVALDTLRACGAYQQLYPDQVAEVLQQMTEVMVERNQTGMVDDG